MRSSSTTGTAMDECNVTLESLAQFRDAELSDTAAARLKAHVESGCSRCAENLRWLSETTAALQQGADFVRPSQTAIRQAQRLFRERQQSPSLLETIAKLVFDNSVGSPALAGVRDAGSDVFQRLYSTEAFDIDLWGERTEADTYYLIGQVRSRTDGTAVEPNAVSLSLSQAETETEQEPYFALPEAGEFHVPDLPAGKYTIRLRLAEEGIVLSDVVVGE
jgi:hypothetical protein